MSQPIIPTSSKSLEFFPDDDAFELIAQHLHACYLEPDSSLPPLQLESLPPIVEDLQREFALSAFECHAFLLCAMPKLHARVGVMLAVLNFDDRQRQPTPSALLKLFSGDHAVDRRALQPGAKLFRFGLLRMEGEATGSPQFFLTTRAERWLFDASPEEPGAVNWALLEPILRRVSYESVPFVLTKAQAGLRDQMQATAMSREDWLVRGRKQPLTTVSLHGGDAESRRAVAVALAQRWRLHLHVLPLSADDFDSSHALPISGERGLDPVQPWVQALNRESRLQQTAFLLEPSVIGPSDVLLARVAELLERTEATLILSSREPLELPFSRLQSFELPMATLEDQPELWVQALQSQAAGIAPNSSRGLDWVALHERVLPRVLNYMTLNASMIARAADKALRVFESEYGSFNDLEDNDAQQIMFESFIWDAAKVQIRLLLDASPLLRRLVRRDSDTPENLMLTPEMQVVYDEIKSHVKRSRLGRQRGLMRGRRGRGVTVLFSGISGTGKTTTAEALARDLDLDLYIVDLSQTQSKYIGETGKHLQSLLDLAQYGGVVILFDEADAVFGKRTAVKDSHDRYANQEVNVLLQGIENFQGLAILTTNLETSMDNAFLRRLRFIMRFKIPQPEERLKIWCDIIPEWSQPEHNPDSDLNFEHLAQLEMTGAMIVNTMRQAGFKSLEEGRSSLTMLDVFHAAQDEVKKERLAWKWNWVSNWALDEDILAQIPEDNRHGHMHQEMFRALERMFKDAGIPEVTAQRIDREWHASVTQTLVNLFCFSSRPNGKLNASMGVVAGQRVNYRDYLFIAFIAAKEDDERHFLDGLVSYVIQRHHQRQIPPELIKSAGGYTVYFAEGQAEDRVDLHRVQSYLDAPIEVGHVFVVSLPTKIVYKT